MKKYKTPQNVIDHIESVTKVALIIASKLNEKGINVDEDIVERASLLHDLVKYVDFPNFDRFKEDSEIVAYYEEMKKKYGTMKHIKASAEIVKEEGFEELSEVMLRHGFMVIGTEKGPQTWEEKILNYADKRVKHDKIVDLQARFDDLRERYFYLKHKNYDITLVDDKEKLFFDLEKELFASLDIKPGEIA